MWQNATGVANTATGYSSLIGNTTGALNTASGVESLRENTAGNANTASGTQALQWNVVGNENTASGYRALYHATGSRNIAVGTQAGSALTVGDHNIYLGHPGVHEESDTIRIGEQQTKVFIAGITAPLSGLPVVVTTSGQLGTGPASREEEILRIVEQQAQLIRDLTRRISQLERRLPLGKSPQAGG